MTTNTLVPELLQKMDACWRAANYLSVGQIYLCENPLLRRPLALTDVKHMTVLNDLDRFHLVMDTIDRLPQTGDKGITLKQQLKNKLVEHKQYIDKNGQDLPEIRNWKWQATRTNVVSR